MVHVSLYRNDNGARLDTYHSQAVVWIDAVREVFEWLRIEVLPYWKPGDLHMVWPSDTHELAGAALYGISLCCGLERGMPPQSVAITCTTGFVCHE